MKPSAAQLKVPQAIACNLQGGIFVCSRASARRLPHPYDHREYPLLIWAQAGFSPSKICQQTWLVLLKNPSASVMIYVRDPQ